MIDATRRPGAMHFVVSVLAGAAIGASIGIASAQNEPTGQLDPACASQCTAHGYDAGFCGEVCWVPDAGMVSKAEDLNWKCVTVCRDLGGKLSDCLPRCQRR